MPKIIYTIKVEEFLTKMSLNENPMPLIFYFLVYNSMIQESLSVIHTEIKLTN